MQLGNAPRGPHRSQSSPVNEVVLLQVLAALGDIASHVEQVQHTQRRRLILQRQRELRVQCFMFDPSASTWFTAGAHLVTAISEAFLLLFMAFSFRDFVG